MVDFDLVEDYLQDAEAITWDGCHKIYVLMDDEQVAKMIEYGYEPIIALADITPAEASGLVRDWYEESCWLKFVQAIRTDSNGSPDFVSLIEQGAGEDEEDED